MKLQILLSLLSLSFLTTAQNASTNYLGSTPSQRHAVNETQAGAILQACALEAANIKSPSNIAVVDPSALLVGFLRTDNAFPGSIDISIKKARTVALFNGAFTTAALLNMTQPPGAMLYGIEETNGGLVVFGGGIPIFLDGYLIGAVGVSGGTTEQDITVATAGVKALGATSSPS